MKTCFAFFGIALLAMGWSQAFAQSSSSLVLRTGEKEESTKLELVRQPHIQLYFLVEDAQAGSCQMTAKMWARGGPLAIPVKSKIEVTKIASGENKAVFQVQADLPPEDKTVAYALLVQGEASGTKIFQKLIQIQFIGEENPTPAALGKKDPTPKTEEKL